LKGFDTIEGGDVILVSAGMVPLEDAGLLLPPDIAKSLAYGKR
jgi:hypothetical protein